MKINPYITSDGDTAINMNHSTIVLSDPYVVKVGGDEHEVFLMELTPVESQYITTGEPFMDENVAYDFIIALLYEIGIEGVKISPIIDNEFTIRYIINGIVEEVVIKCYPNMLSVYAPLDNIEDSGYKQRGVLSVNKTVLGLMIRKRLL